MTPGDDIFRFVLTGLLAAVGAVLIGGGALGVLRFPDVLARLHAIRALSWGAPFLLAAVAVEAWRLDVTLRLAVLSAAVAVTGAAISHLIAQEAHRAGVDHGGRR